MTFAFVVSMQFLQHFCNQSCPSGLMTRPKTTTGFTMEVFVKQDQVLPVRIIPISSITPVARSVSQSIRQKQIDLSSDDLVRHFFQIHHHAGSGRAFDLQ